jgi:tripartite-type tricarboxylate transporter receptor subunit TctC
MSRKTISTCLLALLGATVIAAFAVSPILAADYPIKNITAISPWPAGSASSNAFKGYMEYAEKHLGGKIIVDYRPGGIGAIGFQTVKNARPDGYTLGMLTVSVHQIELDKLTDVSYRDFELLNMFTFQPRALIVHADSPWKTSEEFFAYAKQNPGQIKCGYEGIGNVDVAVMSNAAGIKLTAIPFGGTAESLVALLGKHIDALSTSIPLAAPHLKAGTMRLLAVYGDNRLETYSDIPTLKEKGLNVVRGGWRIVVLPKGVPAGVRDKLTVALKKAFEDSDFKKWADKADIGPYYMAPEKVGSFLQAEFQEEKKVWELLKKK